MITVSLIKSADNIVAVHGKSLRYTMDNKWVILDCDEAGEYKINLSNVGFIRTVPDAAA